MPADPPRDPERPEHPEHPEHPEDPPRRGVDVARQALAAARAAARARPSGSGQGPGSATSTPRQRRTGPATLSGAGPDERDPQALGRTIDRLVAERGWEVDRAVGGVLGRWDQLVGEDTAAHCRPESFSSGVLVVRTDSSAWATQLRLLTPALLRRLNEDLGHGTVTTVRVLGPAGPSWRRGSLSVRGRGPRDTYG